MIDGQLEEQAKSLKYGSREYKQALKRLNLKIYERYDPASARMGGWAKYLVAPIIENDKKIGWQIYFKDEAVRPTMDSFKTKKEAIEYLRDEISEMNDPWYSDLPGYGTAQGVYLGDGVYVH